MRLNSIATGGVVVVACGLPRPKQSAVPRAPSLAAAWRSRGVLTAKLNDGDSFWSGEAMLLYSLGAVDEVDLRLPLYIPRTSPSRLRIVGAHPVPLRIGLLGTQSSCSGVRSPRRLCRPVEAAFVLHPCGRRSLLDGQTTNARDSGGCAAVMRWTSSGACLTRDNQRSTRFGW